MQVNRVIMLMILYQYFLAAHATFTAALDFTLSATIQILRPRQEFHYLHPSQGILWVQGHPPAAHPPCGFDGSLCHTAPAPKTIVVATLCVCVVLVGAIFAFR